MLDGIKQDAVKVLLTVRLQSLEDVPNDNFAEEPDELKLQHSSIETNSTDPVSSTISRNSPCPCGSGKKYKHCHGSLT
jgi:preprotein translocase subunit SecA